MSYDAWKLRAPEDEPGFDMREFAPVPDGVTCKGCGHFIEDASDEPAHKISGLWYCGDCFAELSAEAKEDAR